TSCSKADGAAVEAKMICMVIHGGPTWSTATQNCSCNDDGSPNCADIPVPPTPYEKCVADHNGSATWTSGTQVCKCNQDGTEKCLELDPTKVCAANHGGSTTWTSGTQSCSCVGGLEQCNENVQYNTCVSSLGGSNVQTIGTTTCTCIPIINRKQCITTSPFLVCVQNHGNSPFYTENGKNCVCSTDVSNDMMPINMLLDTASFLIGIVAPRASIINDIIAQHAPLNQRPVMAINSHIQPQQTNVFSTMPDSKGSINSSKLLDTGPEKNPEENGQRSNVLEIKNENTTKNEKEATVTATASNKNNVSGSSGAGSTLDISSSTASVTENKTSTSKRVEKHKIKLQTPLFAPYSKPNAKKKLNKPTGNVAQTQIKKENTDFNEINDIEIEDGEVIEYEDDSIIPPADNVTQINSDEIAIDDNNNDPSDHEMLNTQEVNSMNEYFAEKNGQEWIDQIAKDAEKLDSVKTCFKNLVENIPLSMDNKVKVDMLMTLAKETKNKMIAIPNGKSTTNTQDKSVQVKPLLLTKKYRKTMPKEQGKSAPNDYEKLEPMGFDYHPADTKFKTSYSTIAKKNIKPNNNKKQ
ncbi:hypothetical protein BB558_006270, partial [Smittium angustum]